MLLWIRNCFDFLWFLYTWKVYIHDCMIYHWSQHTIGLNFHYPVRSQRVVYNDLWWHQDNKPLFLCSHQCGTIHPFHIDEYLVNNPFDHHNQRAQDRGCSILKNVDMIRKRRGKNLYRKLINPYACMISYSPNMWDNYFHFLWCLCKQIRCIVWRHCCNRNAWGGNGLGQR